MVTVPHRSRPAVIDNTTAHSLLYANTNVMHSYYLPLLYMPVFHQAMHLVRTSLQSHYT